MFSFTSLFNRFLSLFCKEKLLQTDSSGSETPPPLLTAPFTPAITTATSSPTPDVIAAICAGLSMHMANSVSAASSPTPDVIAAICAGLGIHMANSVSAASSPTPDVIAVICAGVSVATVDTPHNGPSTIDCFCDQITSPFTVRPAFIYGEHNS